VFVQVIQGRTGDADQLRVRMDRWVRDLSAGAIGWLGSTAGFVQIVRGRYTDPAKAVELLQRSEQPLRELRPDVIGGELCLHGDGGFTEAVYFTSESEARVGERKQPPPQAQAWLDEGAAITTDLTFYDLMDPWLHSPR
jgi:hypothetical protein